MDVASHHEAEAQPAPYPAALRMDVLPLLPRGSKPCGLKKCAGREEVALGPTKRIVRRSAGCRGMWKEQP